ncbi:hypothetical protein WJX81_003708 [Elliptochloris bilobata]|uniref:Survival protein SurE-like phosphatase/nucleotidase domain-containing protein n=1 Tax=Elliptochloris bilobata TaxID=381761 RepID=A0AAW1RY31_9CHLO
MGKKRVLISNDDGINAPGLRALVEALVSDGTCTVCVCGPADEQSAKSHAITLGRPLLSYPISVPDVEEAFAVEGTPADSVMLGLSGLMFKDGADFDLCVGGINRGDNCGLHVIYSGTVGAAREAACKGLPSLAVSLDDTRARDIAAFRPAARITAALIKALLRDEGDGGGHRLRALVGSVLNINFPAGSRVRGLYLAHQGSACVFPAFKEVYEEVSSNGCASDGRRLFRNTGGGMQWDGTPGSDTWAVREGWASVTPLGLRSDLAFGHESGAADPLGAADVPRVAAALMRAAAAELDLEVGGVSKL